MRVLLLLAAVLCVCSAARAADQPLLELNFDGPDPLAGLQGDAATLTTGYGGGRALMIDKPEPAGTLRRFLHIDGADIAGKTLTVSARVRADGVTDKPNPWNGIKVMLILEIGEGRDYPQLPFGTGTFDWTYSERLMRIPSDVTGATLILGLEEVAGRVWFDDVTIRVGRPDRGGHRSEVMFTGHDVPRLRGVMHGPATTEENIRVLAREWGANQVRLQINWTPMREAEQRARDLDAMDRWLDRILPEIDNSVALCEKYGLLVLLDLHTPPGGRIEGGVCPLFTQPAAQEKLVEVWQRLARRYKGRRCIYAYDLLNEPVEPPPGPGVVTWPALFTRVTKAIREIDPGKPVVFEPGPWGGCAGFDGVGALGLDNVIYSFHMYEPHQFTHQGVGSNPTGISYPGKIGAIFWDKERLREAMRPAIDFQKEFNVQIYVGEFSAIRWAPGDSAYNYLRDCIDLFEEYGWDWSYHAYREWPGWSVEHGPDPNDWDPTPEPTKRKILFLDWFAKNEKPEF
jgi:endoglucanase